MILPLYLAGCSPTTAFSRKCRGVALLLVASQGPNRLNRVSVRFHRQCPPHDGIYVPRMVMLKTGCWVPVFPCCVGVSQIGRST